VSLLTETNIDYVGTVIVSSIWQRHTVRKSWYKCTALLFLVRKYFNSKTMV